MIYEVRLNVIVDAVIFCLKIGNVVVFRGSLLVIYSNKVFVSVMKCVLGLLKFLIDVVQFIEDISKEIVKQFFILNDGLDVLILCGGKNLIDLVVRELIVFVLEIGVGNCYVYIDELVDFDMVRDVVINVKIQWFFVCNVIEFFLIYEKWVEEYG